MISFASFQKKCFVGQCDLLIIFNDNFQSSVQYNFYEITQLIPNLFKVKGDKYGVKKHGHAKFPND